MLIFCSFAPLSYSDGAKNISGTFHDHTISLRINDKTASGTITSDEHNIKISDAKIIIKHDRMYVFDGINDLKIMLKQKHDKYLVIAKSESFSSSLRFVAGVDDGAKNISQRNLFDEMNQKQNKEPEELTEREKMLLEKEKRLEQAQKIHEKRLAQLDKENKSSKDILAEFEKSKKLSGMKLITPNNTSTTKETAKDVQTDTADLKGIKAYVSAPHNVEWKHTLRYTVLITDDTRGKYDSQYKAFVGNKLAGANVTGTIKNPQGQTVQEISGSTDESGVYVGSWHVPDNTPTRGEYTISVTAVYNSIKQSVTDTFFVFALNDNGSSKKTADTTKTVTLYDNMSVSDGI